MLQPPGTELVSIFKPGPIHRANQLTKNVRLMLYTWAQTYWIVVNGGGISLLKYLAGGIFLQRGISLMEHPLTGVVAHGCLVVVGGELDQTARNACIANQAR